MSEQIVRRAKDALFLHDIILDEIGKDGIVERNISRITEGYVLFNRVGEASKEGLVEERGRTLRFSEVRFRRYTSCDRSHVFSWEEFDRMGRPNKLEIKVEIKYSKLNGEIPHYEGNDIIKLGYCNVGAHYDEKSSSRAEL